MLQKLLRPLRRAHNKLPSKYLRKVPFEAFAIVTLLVLLNLIVWGVCLGVLHKHTEMYATAVLAWSLGLRHALDADHISAIDLMTRRLIASGQRPVTVGTFFSLGHSTIVIVTSLVTAATAAHLATKFDRFSSIGNIIGTSVSATFLILLGVMNAWILWKLVLGLRGWVRGEVRDGKEGTEDLWEKRGGGPMWWVLKKLFRLIDKPWKMYPLGVVFGLGFDTSSEIALLGLSSLQASKGTSIWLILCFPVLFTVGMCMIDTLDGAGMMIVYTWCGDGDVEEGEDKGLLRTHHGEVAVEEEQEIGRRVDEDEERDLEGQAGKGKDIEDSTADLNMGFEPTTTTLPILSSDSASDPIPIQPKRQGNSTLHDPLIFLYYSTLLTALTVLVALVIGLVQLFSLLQNVIKPEPTGKFWDGVTALSDHYDIVGGSIAGGFVVVGVLGVLCWPRFKVWIGEKRRRYEEEMRGGVSLDAEEEGAQAGLIV